MPNFTKDYSISRYFLESCWICSFQLRWQSMRFPGYLILVLLVFSLWKAVILALSGQYSFSLISQLLLVWLKFLWKKMYSLQPTSQLYIFVNYSTKKCCRVLSWNDFLIMASLQYKFLSADFSINISYFAWFDHKINDNTSHCFSLILILI